MVSRFGSNNNFPVLKNLQELVLSMKNGLLKTGDVVLVNNDGELLVYKIAQNGRAVLA